MNENDMEERDGSILCGNIQNLCEGTEENHLKPQ
jgi:hypothetical protein